MEKIRKSNNLILLDALRSTLFTNNVIIKNEVTERDQEKPSISFL